MDRVALRRWGALLVGVLLGAWAVSSWALVPGWALDPGATIRTNISASGGVSVSSPVASWPATADGAGGARLLRAQALKVPANQAALQLSRLVSVASLARAARIAAGMAGPLALAGLAYEGLQYLHGQWQAVDSAQGGLCWNVSGPYASECTGYSAAICELPVGAVGHGYAYVPAPEWQNQVKPSLFSVQYLKGQPAPAGWQAFNNCTSRPMQDGYFPVALAKVGSPGYVPATEQQMEISFQQGLIAAPNKAPEVLRSVVDYVQPEAEPLQVTGPATLPGPAETTTTVTDAGVQTRLRATTYNITYQGDVVTVTETTTTTTTHPDASQTVETTTTAEPQAGGDQAPPKDPGPDVCVEHPDASGCQPLGEHDDDIELEEQTRDVDFDQTLSAAGSCPAAKQVTMMGRSYSLEWTPLCDLASGVRPVVIALSWLSAGAFLFMVGRGAS